MIHVKVKNVSQVLNLLNVLLVKDQVLLILDKVQCKFKWDVIPVMVKELLLIILVLIVKDQEQHIEHKKNQ